MFCPKCGLEVEDGLEACPRCGEGFGNVKTTKRPSLFVPIALLGVGALLIIASLALFPEVVGAHLTIFDIGTF